MSAKISIKFEVRRKVLTIVSLAAVFGLFILYAEASPLDTEARTYILLIDQSGSVVNASAVRALARQTSAEALRQLRANAGVEDTIQVIFFGARMVTVITPTLVMDTSIDERLQTALADSHPLGVTPIAETLESVLQNAQAATDVILITDGAPDTAETGTRAGQLAYAERLRQLAARYAGHGLTLSVVLIGQSASQDWRMLWQDVASTSKGAMLEIHSPEDVNPALQTLVTTLAPTPTPSPRPTLRATVRATLAPTSTPVCPGAMGCPTTATPSFTEHVKGTPTVSSPARFALLGLGTLSGLVALRWALKLVRQRRPKAQSAAGDEGFLEIYDTHTGEMRRIELLGLTLNQAWSLSCGPSPSIHPKTQEGEIECAVLHLTSNGLQIESRGETLWFEDRPVRKQQLFDGDRVQVGQYTLTYQNFFRRRGVTKVEEDSYGGRG